MGTSTSPSRKALNFRVRAWFKVRLRWGGGDEDQGEASNGYVVSVQIMNASLCNVPKTVD